MNPLSAASPGVPKFTLPPQVAGMSRKILDDFDRVLREVNQFAVGVGDSLRSEPELASRFIHQTVAATEFVFQKWNLEILYLLALVHKMRFSQLKNHLEGISSRTLSLKLDALEEAKLLNRTVLPDKPLRVEYSPTTEGRTLARLTVPLVMFLNQRLGLDLNALAETQASKP